MKSYSFEDIKKIDYSKYAPLFALVILIILSALASEHFLKFRNITNILRQVSYTGTIALGMTFVIVAAGIDLSVGSMVALVGVLAIFLMNYLGTSVFAVVAAVFVAILVGSLCGAVNGLIVTRGKITSFIATLATMIIGARLRRFPVVQEDAAMDLGASRMRAVFSVTIPYLVPALFSAGIVAFMLSFENFGTTLFLIGADPTLPILFFSRLRFSVTPEINAVSLVLMAGTVILGIVALGLGQLRKYTIGE